ncbi:MAG: hypothetical protein C4538_11585 [Nitrospiraceae bacterium]|nr:MAG: hypothetical protein C4538_11585 [Nitrospiraceae bacterium]
MSYLDTDKSVIISSPAGSGKTEKLARRYISLLNNGVDVERILAITFTDKAAAEMKQRILNILKAEAPELFASLIRKMPLMRVTTIHSFCGTLLRRFSFEAGIDPNYVIQDAIDSRMAWDEILYEVLMDAGRESEGHELLLQSLSDNGFRGLDLLKRTIDYLFQKSPFSLEAASYIHTPGISEETVEELKAWDGVRGVIDNYDSFFEKGYFTEAPSAEEVFLTDKKEPRKRAKSGMKNIPDFQNWTLSMYRYWKDRKLEEYAQRSERILKIFTKCIGNYAARKRAGRMLDFSDLEYLAYRILTEHPEWANILYAFDERTDHVLVDEFQDTNTFQWAIISKLTEEWRSGLGAKRAEGIHPTVFLVGDEKQSIYFFRGANVEIFQGAREQLEAWLGKEFHYEEAKENYRSLPVITEFANHVCSKIMSALTPQYPWRTRYGPFSATRPGNPYAGKVEIILLEDKEKSTISDTKQNEAETLAQRIKALAGNFQITDKSSRQQRLCRYMDVAVLLRKRTHLKSYEEALRKYQIPFVAVKGIGFYQEPEVAMLRALVFFLSNPRDDYSLYMLLKSRLFDIDEGTILQLISREGSSLFEKMKAAAHVVKPLNISSPLTGGDEGEGEFDFSTTPTLTLPHPWGGNSAHQISIVAELLDDWLSQCVHSPLPEVIEKALVSTRAWRYFHEPQKKANIRKFIRLMEKLEAEGKSLIRIRDFLERTFDSEDEAKANVNTEGMDAVKIMTVHAAKGLEFPIVFVPGIEEPLSAKTSDSLMYERGGRFFYKSIPEASIRRDDDDFLIQEAKEEEEQKRLFYVAVTRAAEGLFLVGTWNDKERNFLSFLKKGLGLEKREGTFIMESDLLGIAVLTGGDVHKLYERAPEHKELKKERQAIQVLPLPAQKQKQWRSVTESVEIRSQHGEDRMMMGDIMHTIFEWISTGALAEQDIRQKAEILLREKNVPESLREEKIALIEKDIITLRQKGVWNDIIMPRENSYAELPFTYEEGDIVYTGRIDRIIKEGSVYNVYDYKTFPVKDKEIGYLLKEYSFQLHLYKRAVMKLFDTKEVKSFIVFSHTGEIHEV